MKRNQYEPTDDAWLLMEEGDPYHYVWIGRASGEIGSACGINTWLHTIDYRNYKEARRILPVESPPDRQCPHCLEAMAIEKLEASVS